MSVNFDPCRFSARTRLSVMEEKLLQQTLKYVEQCVEEDVSREGGWEGGRKGWEGGKEGKRG